MTDFPEVKLKALVNFPPNTSGRIGISVSKENGAYFVDLNYKDIQITPTIPAPDMPNVYNLVYDNVKDLYELVPFALQATAGVASLGGQTGALDIGNGLTFTGDTLEVAIGAGLKFDGSNDVAADIATTAQATVATDNTKLMTPALLLQAEVANTPRAIPSGHLPIGVRPDSVQKGSGLGRVKLNHTPMSYVQDNFFNSSTSSVGYVDDQNGNDGNSGATDAAAYKTIDYAGSESVKQIFIVKPGLYAPPTMVITDNAYVSAGRYLKQFFLMPGAVIAMPGPRLQDQTFTVWSGTVYQAALTLTGAQTVHCVTRRDLRDAVAGQPIPFLQYATKEALRDSGLPGWAITTASGNKTIYIRCTLGADTNVNNNKSILKGYYTDINAETLWKVDGVPVLIHAAPGGGLFDGVGIRATDLSGQAGELYLDNLFSRFSSDTAFQTNGGTNFYRGLIGHSSKNDAFNDNPGTAGAFNLGVQHDCHGTLAGNIATFGTGIAPNKNGFSAHDNTYISRFGCTAEGNFGPQFADIANATTALSWNVACVAGPSQSPSNPSADIGFYSQDAGRTSIYDQCHAYGNGTAISNSLGVAKAFGCVFDGATVGTVGTYNPATGA